MLWIYNIEKEKRQLSFLRKFQEKFLKKGGWNAPFLFWFFGRLFYSLKDSGRDYILA